MPRTKNIFKAFIPGVLINLNPKCTSNQQMQFDFRNNEFRDLLLDRRVNIPVDEEKFKKYMKIKQVSLLHVDIKFEIIPNIYRKQIKTWVNDILTENIEKGINELNKCEKISINHIIRLPHMNLLQVSIQPGHSAHSVWKNNDCVFTNVGNTNVIFNIQSKNIEQKLEPNVSISLNYDCNFVISNPGSNNVSAIINIFLCNRIGLSPAIKQLIEPQLNNGLIINNNAMSDESTPSELLRDDIEDDFEFNNILKELNELTLYKKEHMSDESTPSELLRDDIEDDFEFNNILKELNEMTIYKKEHMLSKNKMALNCEEFECKESDIYENENQDVQEQRVLFTNQHKLNSVLAKNKMILKHEEYEYKEEMSSETETKNMHYKEESLTLTENVNKNKNCSTNVTNNAYGSWFKEHGHQESNKKRTVKEHRPTCSCLRCMLRNK